MQFNWEALLVGGMGGVVSVMLTQLISIIRDRFTSRRNTLYGALRVAIVLERYAHACHSHIMTTEGDLDAGAEGKSYNIPDIDKYPEDVEWKYINTELANDALSVVNEISKTQSKLLFEIKYNNNKYQSIE